MTAVEWLVDEIKTLIENGYVFNPKWEETMIKQALEIEKQQIINTWYDCKLSIIDKNPTDADQYYNEKFKIESK